MLKNENRFISKLNWLKLHPPSSSSDWLVLTAFTWLAYPDILTLTLTNLTPHV